MRNLKITIFAFVAAVLVLTSCNKDKNPVEASTSFSDFFPAEINNWWQYYIYELDSDGNRLPNPILSKVTSKGEISIGGKNAIMMIEEDQSSFKAETSYYYIDDSKLYSYFEDEDSGSGVWIIAADLKATSSWDILNTPLSTELFGMPFVGSISIKGKKGGISKIKINDKEVDAQEFIVETIWEGKATVEEIETNFKSKNTVQYFFAKGFGLIQLIENPTEVEIGEEKMKENGTDSILLYYYVN